ncbi:putative methyltransferase [Actinacidiphila reveromycinica]|uniref:Putative methyltransferase n=1 Tax=Actinacidiphila reveromycinica TaxID=659352 RepID=A0A7U3VSJ8_9ACTN|nr:class I SAM-dependent methyltransferase [Streptomyces sp. SN-593]BBB01905.1 putative methyltransferase [Streptomyces sp. SN-593]
MEIDFHDRSNRMTYARRTAADDWARLMRALGGGEGLRVADVGCGGGIYSAAWLDLGAASVVGLDFSAAMLSGARENCGDRDRLSFRQADAYATGLDDASVDVVFARALIHHLDDLDACFAEAARVLAPSGRLIVQDRTIEDVTRPGSPSHLRGYFFERFPFLLDSERARRPSSAAAVRAMTGAGLHSVEVHTLRETRRVYGGAEEVRQDLLARTGRSILHLLDDEQLGELADFVVERLGGAGGVRECDDWTVWVATK